MPSHDAVRRDEWPESLCALYQKVYALASSIEASAEMDRPPKAVYSVTSSGHDFFSVMSRISIASLRLSNPGIKVTVACDAVSARDLKSCCDPLLDEVDEFLECETPPGDAGYRNRHMKTRLREIVGGRFLFLDSDTLVRGDLSPIFSLNADIAGARNHSRDQFRDQVWEQDAETLTSMKWQVGQEGYINGGVLFFNETPGAHRFGSAWHQKWLDAFANCGRHRDQPALNSALFEVRPRLHVLPDKFNAQFRMAPHSAENAVIWHSYASCFEIPLTSFEVLIERILKGEGLCLGDVAHMIQHPHPWRRASWLDDWAATGLASKVRMDPGYRAWFQGRRSAAWCYWTVSALRRRRAASRRLLKLLLSRLDRCRAPTA